MGVSAFQWPTDVPGSGFMGYLQHLVSGDKFFNTTTPDSPSADELGVDLATGDVNSSQVVQNPDGDVLERVEFIQENMLTSVDWSEINNKPAGLDDGDDVLTETEVETYLSNGSVKIGNSVSTCDGTTEGSLRYNSTGKYFEGCDGTAWTEIQ